MSGARRDPRFGAAVLKLSFLSGGSPAPGYREVYEGTLRDLGLTDAEVDRYLSENREAVEAACRVLRRRREKGD